MCEHRFLICNSNTHTLLGQEIGKSSVSSVYGQAVGPIACSGLRCDPLIWGYHFVSVETSAQFSTTEQVPML